MKTVRLLFALVVAGWMQVPAQATAMHMSNASNPHTYASVQRLDARFDLDGGALVTANAPAVPAAMRAPDRQAMVLGATPILAGPDLGALRKVASGTGLDGVLLFLVLVGLVAFQLRRTQDSLQRPFNNT